MFSCSLVGGNQWSSWEVMELSLGSAHLFLSSEDSGIARWPSCVLGSTIRDLSQRSLGKRISVMWYLALWVDPKSLTGANRFMWSLWDFLEVRHWHSDAM